MTNSKAMAMAVLIALAAACEREAVQPLPPSATAPPASISELMEQLSDYKAPAGAAAPRP